MPLEPVVVEYCPTCACPFEYCDNAGCKRAKMETEMAKASVSGGDGDGDGAPAIPADATTDAATAPEKKKSSKKAKAKGVTITRTTRNKKKTITNVAGLEHFDGVKVADAAKAFGKKFACGASVTKGATGKDEIDVQGDVSEGGRGDADGEVRRRRGAHQARRQGQVGRRTRDGGGRGRSESEFSSGLLLGLMFFLAGAGARKWTSSIDQYPFSLLTTFHAASSPSSSPTYARACRMNVVIVSSW